MENLENPWLHWTLLEQVRFEISFFLHLDLIDGTCNVHLCLFFKN